MVKLFVGNLVEGIDSHRLRNLFLQHNLQVQECDVIKNYAFVVRVCFTIIDSYYNYICYYLAELRKI